MSKLEAFLSDIRQSEENLLELMGGNVDMALDYLMERFRDLGTPSQQSELMNTLTYHEYLEESNEHIKEKGRSHFSELQLQIIHIICLKNALAAQMVTAALVRTGMKVSFIKDLIPELVFKLQAVPLDRRFSIVFDEDYSDFQNSRIGVAIGINVNEEDKILTLSLATPEDAVRTMKGMPEDIRQKILRIEKGLSSSVDIALAEAKAKYFTGLSTEKEKKDKISSMLATLPRDLAQQVLESNPFEHISGLLEELAGYDDSVTESDVGILMYESLFQRVLVAKLVHTLADTGISVLDASNAVETLMGRLPASNVDLSWGVQTHVAKVDAVVWSSELDVEAKVIHFTKSQKVTLH